MHHSKHPIYRWILVPALILIAQSCISMPISGAANAPRPTIVFSVLNLKNPGVFIQGETLHFIAVAFTNGKTVTVGEIKLTSNDPLKKTICNIVMNRKHFYCNTSIPNTGVWTISARYRSTLAGPVHYLASRSRRLTITAQQPTTTLPQLQQTETLLGPGTSSYQTTSGGQYMVTMTALVSVIQFFSPLLLSPGGGTVNFFDSAGHSICSITVPSTTTASLLSCTGGPFNAPPVNPISGLYSGTTSGVNDGYGGIYSSSSGSLSIGPS